MPNRRFPRLFVPLPLRRKRNTKRNTRIVVLGALVALALSGCHTMRFEIVNAPHAKVVRHQKTFLFAGLLPRQRRVDVSHFCPHGVSQVREQTTSDDALIGAFTLGIWTPRSSWYYCLPGPGEGTGWMVDVPIPSALDEVPDTESEPPPNDDAGNGGPRS
jgi:hypothetical protein